MVTPAHNFDPKILREGSAKLRWAGRGQGISYFIAYSAICMWSSGVKKALDVGGPSWIDFIYFWGLNEKQRSCDGQRGRAAPRLGWQWAQKDGCAQRTGAHARPKPTTYIIYSSRILCLSSCLSSCRPVIFLSFSCHSCGTLSYSLCFSNQTDQGDERKVFEREGYRWRDRRRRDWRGRCE
jgi:hypothetical protein